MSQVSEIKCPHCGAWNTGTGKVDATCVKCNEYLEPELVAREEEKKIAIAQKQGYYMVIKDSDETIVQIFKMFVNSIRWSAYYVAMLFFVFAAILLLIFGIVAV